MRIIACFGDRTFSTFLGLSDEGNTVSRTDNFVNVFNSVTCPPVLYYTIAFCSIYLKLRHYVKY